MAEYINKGALLDHIESEASIWGDDYDVLQILGDIEDCPPANVRPVVEAEWGGHRLDPVRRKLEMYSALKRGPVLYELLGSLQKGIPLESKLLSQLWGSNEDQGL